MLNYFGVANENTKCQEEIKLSVYVSADLLFYIFN